MKAANFETVFRYGNWNIVRISTSNIYAHHLKCDEIMVWPGNLLTKCIVCSVPVPDEVQALVTLNNWYDI